MAAHGLDSIELTTFLFHIANLTGLTPIALTLFDVINLGMHLNHVWIIEEVIDIDRLDRQIWVIDEIFSMSTGLVNDNVGQ